MHSCVLATSASRWPGRWPVLTVGVEFRGCCRRHQRVRSPSHSITGEDSYGLSFPPVRVSVRPGRSLHVVTAGPRACGRSGEQQAGARWPAASTCDTRGTPPHGRQVRTCYVGDWCVHGRASSSTASGACSPLPHPGCIGWRSPRRGDWSGGQHGTREERTQAHRQGHTTVACLPVCPSEEWRVTLLPVAGPARFRAASLVSGVVSRLPGGRRAEHPQRTPTGQHETKPITPQRSGDDRPRILVGGVRSCACALASHVEPARETTVSPADQLRHA
jgi:hypothetical protein